MPDLDPTTNPDVQEALSRRYSDDIIILLPLQNRADDPLATRLAVFNSARELCGFADVFCDTYGSGAEYDTWDKISEAWHPPTAAPTLTKPPVDLEELDLI